MASPGLDVLILHATVTAFMAGLIWTVQLVHYPLFPFVGGDRWTLFHAEHSSRITWIVGPVMAAEAITAVWLALATPGGVAPELAWIALVALVLVHLATATLSLPAHRALTGRFDASAHRRLVRTNWLRTIGWTLRALIVVLMLRSAATDPHAPI
jgi:hypothetical protein